MTKTSLLAAALVASFAIACSSESTGQSSGADAGLGGSSGASGGGSSGGSPPAPAPTGTSPTCEAFTGTCLRGVKDCPGGSLRVGDGTTELCDGDSAATCCVPASADGARQGNWGLVCSADGTFDGHPGGTCDGAACGVGCSCSLVNGAAACDCSRGLPVARAGRDVCALLSCGTITCAAGCSCTDAATGACACP